MMRWLFGSLTLILAAQGSLRAEIVQSSVLENNLAYLRVSTVNANPADEIIAAENLLTVSNKIAGTILDLRFAGGDGAIKDSQIHLFSDSKLPLVILVNNETTGTAADLAAQLRSSGTGIIIGSANSRITPDVAVTVTAADEKTFLKDPYAILTTTNGLAATNDWLPFIEHTSEADLVRQKVKDGDEDADATPNRPAPAAPVIRDPALARAVDFLKALAILPKARG